MGASLPQIQGAAVSYQYLPGQQQQFYGRRRRRHANTANDLNMHIE